MSRGLAFRIVGLWLVFAVCGVLNGILRESLITPRLGIDAAHVLSTIVLCAVILLGSWLLLKRVRLMDTGTLLLVGIVWLGLTVVFEFGFGHYVMGHPWERLLADYNIFRGRVWVLVLATELVGPLAISRLCGVRGALG